MLTNSIKDDIRHYLLYSDTVMRLIIFNVAIYLLGNILWLIFSQTNHPAYNDMITRFMSMPSDLTQLAHRPWTAITYMFYHQRFFHILFNMIVLYWSGQLFVLYLGEDKVIPLYIIGGLFGGLFFVAGSHLIPSLKVNADSYYLLGASASILTFLFATVAMNPDHEVYVFKNGPFKLKYIAGILFVVYLFSVLYMKDNPGGNLAHIGGAVGGLVYIRIRHWGYDMAAPFIWVANLFKKHPKVKVSYKSADITKTTAKRGKNEQDRVDEILDKIARSGYDSLTKEEKDFLFQYSKK